MLAPAAWAQRPSGGADDFGYRLFDDSDSECTDQFVDIAASGAVATLTASGADPALDEGAAVLTLTEPFEFYGQALSAVVASANGYLAAAGSLAEEDGGDFSNDPQLPAVPGNGTAAVARLFAFHEDLSGETTGGEVRSEHFAVCPRASGALAGEACTVIQWSSWGFVGSAGAFDFQAILYHGSYAVAFQIDLGALSHDGATLGIQDFQAANGLGYAPSGALTGSTAVCLFEPRFPATGRVADLSITKTNKTESLIGATDATYEIVVRNAGPSPVVGALVSDPIDPPLENCIWTCSASVGSSCTASGMDDISDSVDLEVDGWALYELDCDIDAGGAGPVANTASVSAPADVSDPERSNNSATDSDPLPIRLFSFSIE